MKRSILLACSLLLFIFSNAQWNTNTSQNLAVAGVNSSDIVTKETSTGKTFIAFYSQNGSNYDMRAQLIDSNGVKLFGDNGVLVSSRTSGSATFVFNACVDRENDFIITFQFQKPGGAYEIVAYKIDTLGNSLWGIQNDGLELGQGLAAYPFALRNDNVIVSWTTDTGTIAIQKISSVGKTQWSTPKIISGTHTVTRPQVVSNATKSFTIIYQSEDIPPFYTHLYAQKFDQDGNALWGAPLQLSNVVTAGYSYYTLLANTDTTYVGYFGNPSGSNRFDGYVQRINPDGTLPWGINGSEFATYSSPTQPFTFSPSLAHGSGSSNIWAVATMSDANQVNYGISIQSFDATTGARLLGNHAKTVFPISSTGDQQQGKLVLCNGYPLFMFTDATNALYATELDSSGNFAWSQQQEVIGGTTNSKLRFSFNKKPLGDDAVAVWQEDRGAGDMPYAQNIGCDGSTGPLPVSLINFHGIDNGGLVDLYWQTSQEINNTGFEVQRSLDDNSFSKIAFVSTLAQNGNSSQALNYSYADLKVPSGNIYYRLKQIDKDGKSTYSNTLLIKSVLKPGMVAYPNPVSESLNINFTSTVNTQVTFIVTDMLGRVLAKQTQSIFNGENALKINCTSLMPGMYLLKSIGSNGSATYVQKFVKQ